MNRSILYWVWPYQYYMAILLLLQRDVFVYVGKGATYNPILCLPPP